MVTGLAPRIAEIAGELLDATSGSSEFNHPREDLISKLAAVEADGERLTDEEVVNFSFVLLLAGHITTTALLGNTVLCLDEHPEVLTELRADRSLIPAAIEEVLRYRSSFTQVGRVTMTETKLAGQIIPADAIVTPWLLSANRDERASSTTPTGSTSTAAPTYPRHLRRQEHPHPPRLAPQPPKGHMDA